MTDIRFYHLTRQTMEQALPLLLEKTLKKNWKAVVLTASAERAEALSQSLWTYRPDSFLPHGSAKDGRAVQQPVWITAEEENPNGAEVLFLTEGIWPTDASSFSLVCALFDGHDDDAVKRARLAWQKLKADGNTLTYWQQTNSGWVQQA